MTDVDKRITKEQFRRAATAAIESLLSVPDDLWDLALTTVVIRYNNNYEVYVGIRDAEEEPDDC
jgi:hypothetical protein